MFIIGRLLSGRIYQSAILINILLLIIADYAGISTEEFPKRMFFQTRAKVVKFRFIVNKKRKL